MKDITKSSMRFIRLFFPFVLLAHHLKHNLLGIFYWIFFFLLIFDKIGVGFGLSYLFLSPEYQGKTSFFSMLLIGFSFGGLTMAFHSYSYMRMAFRFPFLAVVNKPFVRFCINNSIIPLVFLICYIIRFSMFQYTEEIVTMGRIILYIGGFVLGFSLFIGVSLLYFFPVNKNLFEINNIQSDLKTQSKRWSTFGKNHHIKAKQNAVKNHLFLYIGKGLKIQQCRSTKHYAPALLQSVFNQNRISTTVFEIATVVAFILLGVLGSKTNIDVPAGVSIVLLLTILMMLLSALLTWLRVWTYPILILFFIFLNVLSKHFLLFKFQTQAYGLDYSVKAPYSDSSLYKLSVNQKAFESDYSRYIDYLNRWKAQTQEHKPYLVIVNTSGGGSRSATWVFQVLKECDLKTKFNSSKHIAMITGASGGTIGASYYRSLLLERKLKGSINLKNPTYFNEISSDLLNKLSFSASTNDLFLRYKAALGVRSIHANYSYDRAMAFELDLNEKTSNRLGKPLKYFEQFERKAWIPNLIITPTVVNDGRRILISSMGLSFLMDEQAPSPSLNRIQEDVDLNLLLSYQNTSNLLLSSALRMNATFPYVLPMTTLPTSPEIQVMDAGVRDNFGTKTTILWLQKLENWIAENTAGVILLQIRDNKKIMYQEKVKEFSLFDKFTAPLMNVFSNFPRSQDYDQNEAFHFMLSKFKFPVHTISLNLREYQKNRISLSWHLTLNEKLKIKDAIQRPSNVIALKKYMRLLNKTTN